MISCPCGGVPSSPLQVTVARVTVLVSSGGSRGSNPPRILTNMQPEVASVFITDELARRRGLRPGAFRETLPFRDLTKRMVDDPEQVLPLLVDTAMEICGAVSGGISLYEQEPAPGVFRWHHLRGDLEKFTGATTPRHYSPCGVTLDRRSPILVQRPERVYKWLQDANVSLPECLLVPLYLGADVPLGTLWIVSEAEGQFDSRHADALADLAGFAGLALRMASDQRGHKQALDTQKMLTREMSHRLKNVLAVVQGLMNMASRQGGSATDLAEKMAGILQALSAAQSLVTSGATDGNRWNLVTLKDLLRAILAPYAHGTFNFSGPEVKVGPQSTNVLALIFHELATNAVKYGALSSAKGAINVAWKHGDDSIIIDWRESNGPSVTACPISHGFGTILATKSISALQGRISPDWLAQGLSVQIELPSERLAQ
jgi:two-component sensor histidine kinase